MKKVIESTAYFAIAVVVIWIIGKGCSSTSKDVGEYVYIQPIGGGTEYATLHTDRDCSELEDALYMTAKEAFETGFFITFCTECVTDKQYKQLEKYQKQP